MTALIVQVGMKLCHVFRKRRLKAYFHTGYRMRQGDLPCMEHRAVDPFDQSSRFRIEFHRAKRVLVSVSGVPHQGVPDECAMNAYLMGSAGFYLQLQKTYPPKAFYHLPCGIRMSTKCLVR